MRWWFFAIFLLCGCGNNNLELWYWFGEIHDYHFRHLLNKTWRRINVSLIRKNFSSIAELEESLKVKKPDIALVYPNTLKNLMKSGEIVKVSDTEILKDYCKGYCWPMFKSFVGFYVNGELAREVGFPLNFSLKDLLRLKTEYVVLGLYPSSTFYISLMFSFISEGKDTLNACIETYKFLREISSKPYVRVYNNARLAENDMIMLRIVAIVGTSAYKPYIEREGISLKFVPIINSKNEEVYVLSGPDFVVFKGGNVKKAVKFIKTLDEILQGDTVWEKFGYYYVRKISNFKNVYHTLNMEVNIGILRRLSKMALMTNDTLSYDSVGLLCVKALKM